MILKLFVCEIRTSVRGCVCKREFFWDFSSTDREEFCGIGEKVLAQARGKLERALVISNCKYRS